MLAIVIFIISLKDERMQYFKYKNKLNSGNTMYSFNCLIRNHELKNKNKSRKIGTKLRWLTFSPKAIQTTPSNIISVKTNLIL
jgi:hypothetical protein